MLLGRYVSVEPLVAYRTEALDVYRTAELYTRTETTRSILRHKTETGKGFTLSVCRGEHVRMACGAIAGGRCETTCVPCGIPSASSQRSHPARGTAQIVEVRIVLWKFLRWRRWGEEKERAHCAHRRGLCAGRAPRCQRLPPCVAIGCNRGPSALPGTHCTRGLSRSACAPRGESESGGVRENKGAGDEMRNFRR